MPNYVCRLCRKVILYLQATRCWERMKLYYGCNNWFHQHFENLETPPSSPYNSSKWFGRACKKLPAIHINSVPYIVLDQISFRACLADERMPAVIALVCKKWNLFINEKF